MKSLKVFEYKGNKVAFDEGMVNVSEMGDKFGKKPIDWLKLDSTKIFVSELSEFSKKDQSEIIVTKKGRNGGTWLHKDLALEFAKWLDLKMYFWVNEKINEVTSGKQSEAITDSFMVSLKMANYQMGLATDATGKLKDELMRSKIENQVLKMALACNITSSRSWEILYQIIYSKYKLDFWSLKKAGEKNIDVFHRLKIMNLLFIESANGQVKEFMRFKHRSNVYPPGYASERITSIGGVPG